MMQGKDVRDYFDSEGVVDHYAQATARIGLWLSEEKVFTKLFGHADSILELGCGTGRIAFGLYELGYCNVLATDYSRPMIDRARQIAKLLEYRIPFRVCDATTLEFDDNVFEGAIFGFNGLMQIPKAIRREHALVEIYRVLRPGAYLVFTTHDRDANRHLEFWQAERLRWERGEQSVELDEFGDRAEYTDLGQHFMHVPTVNEMEALLDKIGFHLEAHAMRSALANEPQSVREFSDDCRFWVVRKPQVGE